MMNEKQVKQLLRGLEQQLKKAEVQFAKYDNIDDLEIINALQAQILVIKLVLAG